MTPRGEIDAPVAATGGRNVIAVVGVDRYHHWPRLWNAVRDASGAAALFARLGFEQITEPLFDERATGKAIQELVTDDLMALGPEDSLVLFYAGHGGTRKHRLGDQAIKAGYLIPVDAAASPNKVATWIELEGWLRAVSLLPAKHILVVLDACHSGIALTPILTWRDVGTWRGTPLSTLQARRSRRVITSALDDQVALRQRPRGRPLPLHRVPHRGLHPRHPAWRQPADHGIGARAVRAAAGGGPIRARGRRPTSARSRSTTAAR